MSLLLTDYTVDLGEDSDVAITKSIYDVIEPDKRQSSFTKTITVPSSQQNDKVFADMFDVNFHLEDSGQFAPFFNPSKKAPCNIHTEDFEQITGYAQLTDIIITNGKIEYKLTVYGEVADIFSTLRNSKLSDLDFSEYRHFYTNENIQNSWENTIVINGTPTASELGVGYVYPMVDYGDNHLHDDNGTIKLDWWEVTHFRPWVYVKTIWDKIWATAGFLYKSDFLDTDVFKKLIFQGDARGLSLTNNEIEERSVAAFMDTEQNYTFTWVANTKNVYNFTPPLTAYVTSNIIFGTEDLDPSGQYETASGTTTIGETTRYNIGYNLNIRIDAPSSSIDITADTVRMKFAGIKSDGAVFFAFTKDVNISNFQTGDQYNITIIETVRDLPINITEEWRLCLVSVENVFGNSFPGSGTIRITVETNSTYTLSPTSYLPEGGTVDLSVLMNEDMTQKDFIMNIVKMFNLYIEPYNWTPFDSESGAYVTYLVEPRDDYYTSDVIDWTDKLDNDKPFTIKPNELVKYKFLNYTYANDNDLLNSRYYGQTGRIYGDYIHTIDNDFVKETKKIEIGFSQCIISDQSQLDHWTGRDMPVDKTVDGEYRQDGKPKILFWQGLFGGESWLFQGEEIYNVPYAGQLDDRYNPTVDLNFKLPKVLYYSPDNSGEYVFTSHTLFNKYHYRGITETTDKNSKYVECYMRLFPSDIHNLSFRPLYFIDNAYYRLYEITDHKYDSTTLCKFLKLTDVTGVTGGTFNSRGGRGFWNELDDDLPNRYVKLKPNGGRVGTPETPFGSGTIGGGTTTGGTTDGILASNVMQAGRSRNLILTDDLIDMGFAGVGIASGTTILTGGEGSPLFMEVDTSLGDADIKLPDSLGWTLFVQKTAFENDIRIYDSNDVLKDTLSGKGTAIYMVESSDVRIFRDYSSGSGSASYIFKGTDYNVTNDDSTIQATASGITLTLPDATANIGKPFTLDNASGGSITVHSDEGISGLSISVTDFVLLDGEVLQVQSNGFLYRIR